MTKNDTSFLELTPPAREESSLYPDSSAWPAWRKNWARFRVSSREKFSQSFLNRKLTENTSQATTKEPTAIVLFDGVVETQHAELQNRSQLLFKPETEERMATVDHATAMASIAVGKTVGFCSADLFSAPVVSANKNQFEKNLQHSFEYIPDLVKKYQGRVVFVGTFLAEASTFVNKKIEELLGYGAPVVWAAGNQGRSISEFSPTRNTDVITVGGTSFSDALLWEEKLRSNYGENLTILAPAKYIQAAWNTEKNYNLCSGTSTAAMIVAAALARKIQTFGPSQLVQNKQSELKKVLIEESTKDILLFPKDVMAPNRLLFCEDVSLDQNMINSVDIYVDKSEV